MNIRNAQQAMRSYQNMNGLTPGGAGFWKKEVGGPNLFLEFEPECPSGGNYVWAEGKFPAVGELVLRCSHDRHVPARHEDW